MKTLHISEQQVEILDRIISDAIQKHCLMQLRYVTDLPDNSERLFQYSEDCTLSYTALSEEIREQYDKQESEEKLYGRYDRNYENV